MPSIVSAPYGNLTRNLEPNELLLSGPENYFTLFWYNFKPYIRHQDKSCQFVIPDQDRLCCWVVILTISTMQHDMDHLGSTKCSNKTTLMIRNPKWTNILNRRIVTEKGSEKCGCELLDLKTRCHQRTARYSNHNVNKDQRTTR